MLKPSLILKTLFSQFKLLYIQSFPLLLSLCSVLPFSRHFDYSINSLHLYSIQSDTSRIPHSSTLMLFLQLLPNIATCFQASIICLMHLILISYYLHLKLHTLKYSTLMTTSSNIIKVFTLASALENHS
jgi:hypothetical protein